jgi:3-oxoacyl-[acyl-carrier-protein] synthase III
MLVHDIGILGMGRWDGAVVTNADLAYRLAQSPAVKDPYRGQPSSDGTVRIAGMTLPAARYRRTLDALAQSFEDPFRGTVRRRFFPPNLRASDAEAEAAQKALAAAQIAPDDIGAVLVQSFLPDEVQPRNAALVAHKLGITRAPAWEVDSICNSALTHLTVGASLILSGFARHVLCVQSAAYSRVSDPTSSSSLQEGDMAAAFVLGPAPGTKMACSFRTDGELHGAINLHWAPPAAGAPRRWWERSQETLLIGFDPVLQARVMAGIADHCIRVCDEALARIEMRRDELDLFIAHQPMSWNRAFMEDVLELRDGVAFDTFEEYASINSAGISVSLQEAIRSGRIKKGSKVLLFGPAAGYTYAAMAMRW